MLADFGVVGVIRASEAWIQPPTPCPATTSTECDYLLRQELIKQPGGTMRTPTLQSLPVSPKSTAMLCPCVQNIKPYSLPLL